MTASNPLRAAIYARISQAADDVDKTANQVAEMTQFAEAEGYVVVDTFEDDDISAYKGKAQRPKFTALLVGLREGRFDVVLATEPQRLTRGSAPDLHALNTELVRAGAVLHTRAAGLQNPDAAMTAAMMGMQDIIGGLEVALKTERQLARNRADVAEGLPPKGVRPFGWEPRRSPLSPERAQELGWTLSPAEDSRGAVYLPVRAEEAEVIREAYRAVLEDGATLWGIARQWTAAGVKTDKMGGTRKDRVHDGQLKNVPAVWVASTVRQVLTRPRNAGILVARGVEMPVSRIEPIVSREEHDDLLAMLAQRAAAVAPKPGPKPSYLLGGILECVCGERMHATISYSQRKGGPRHRYHVYKCRNMATDKSQRHSTIQLETADDAVTMTVLRRFLNDGATTPDNAQLVKDLAKNAAAIEAVDANIEHARSIYYDVAQKSEHAYAKGLLSQHQAAREGLVAARDVLNAQRAEGGALASLVEAWKDLPATPDNSMPTWRQMVVLTSGLSVWDQLTMEQRRDIVRGAYRIRLKLGGRGAGRIEYAPVGTDDFAPALAEPLVAMPTPPKKISGLVVTLQALPFNYRQGRR